MGHHLNASILLVAVAVWSPTPVALAQPARGERPAVSSASKAPSAAGDQKSILELQKLALEVAKLESEVRKLDSERQEQSADRVLKLDAELKKLRAESENVAPWWGALAGALFGFFAVALTGWFAWRQSVKARISSFDMKVFEARLANYGRLVAATEALALYAPYRLVDQAACQTAARRLKSQYSSLTGLLLTEESKARYIALTHALMRAANTTNLKVPANTVELREWWDEEVLRNERLNLGLAQKSDVRPEERSEAENKAVNNHQFGDPQTHPAADFIVLHFAASRFRSALIGDIQSRRALNMG